MTEPRISVAADYGIDVSSRSRGAILRRSIEAAAQGVKVVVDFDGVRTVSNSFADEAFGILALSHGKQWIVDKIRIFKASDSVRHSIVEAIAERLAAAHS